MVYAELLGKMLEKHPECWCLDNQGQPGGQSQGQGNREDRENPGGRQPDDWDQTNGNQGGNERQNMDEPG